MTVRADLATRRYRPSGAYTLCRQDALPPAQRAALATLERDAAHYGLLVPMRRRLALLAVDHASARLFGRVAEGMPLDDAGPERDGALARLVLDGALEIEGTDGWVGGPAAGPEVLALPVGWPGAPVGRIAAWSRRALEEAVHLPGASAEDLSRWLYAYGRLPYGPGNATLLTTDCPGRASGVVPGVPDPPHLRADWASGRVPGWQGWQRRDRDAAGARWKLYVSPLPGSLRDALAILVDALPDLDAVAFKVANEPYGLLRPDKLVVYFSEPATLHAAAARLTGRLAGLPAHGVPFTAELGGNGLLSWGIDPADDDAIAGWRGQRSWRVRVTDRLARAIDVAREGPVPPWRHALERLALDGIDPSTFLTETLDG